MKKTSYGIPLIPNPDSQDIAPNTKVWLRRFFSGKTHATYGALLTSAIGAAEAIIENDLLLRIAGVVLVGTGIGIAVDELSHLFSN